MTPIFKKIKAKIEEVALKYKLNEKESESLFSFTGFYQLAAETNPKEYKDFVDFFNKKIKDNHSLANDEKYELAGTIEALEIMKCLYEEDPLE